MVSKRGVATGVGGVVGGAVGIGLTLQSTIPVERLIGVFRTTPDEALIVSMFLIATVSLIALSVY
ncbi:hypothetical protein [Halopenitus persicus]|uniref:Uncharacterized protein n=1 Tax=Halopenitus persicus TaxID=1048396 RepID=A0A1H3JWB1_9EURY|nr:hypothetical protein [Halopenitus persicus]QHS15729.1 hypothetical protein GWK26_00410 [haloarchaeon 3A1-DGR]SDY44161.1 hypothetical protein SAMN05216564_105163 [Halopenitus persicus]